MLLKANKLSKTYSSKVILEKVNLAVDTGDVLGLLGENGAGKSTIMQIISGCLDADEGSLILNDIDLMSEPELYKQQLGFLPEHPPLYKEMRVTEYLRFAARLRNIEKPRVHANIDKSIESCNLQAVHNKRIKHLSKGYQQRVGIAQAIIHEPKLIILDEPTVGLDPVQLEETRELIRSLAKNSAIILSTHIMQEVEACCDRVSIIKQGKVVYEKVLDKSESLHDIFFKLSC